MTRDQLYEALVRLCQDYGTTTSATYELLHEAIDSISEGEGEGMTMRQAADVLRIYARAARSTSLPAAAELARARTADRPAALAAVEEAAAALGLSR